MQPGKLACIAGAAFAVASVAGGQNDEQLFIKEAVQGDLAEVRLGELAAQRAQDEDVRRFAEILRTDHRAALQRATDLAKSMQVEPADGAADGGKRVLRRPVAALGQPIRRCLRESHGHGT